MFTEISKIDHIDERRTAIKMTHTNINSVH